MKNRKKSNGHADEAPAKRRGARGLWNGAISFSLIHIDRKSVG